MPSASSTTIATVIHLGGIYPTGMVRLSVSWLL